MRARTLVIVAVASVVLVGCGVTLHTTRVTASESAIKAGKLAPTQVKGEGIVYALPRTEFEVVQPVKLKFSTNGALRDVHATCTRACGKDKERAPEACMFSTEPKLQFSPPEARTTSVPDYARLYQVTPSADLFQSLTFKFEIASNGVLDKADTTATNTGFEVLSSVASTLLKVAGAPSARMATESSARRLENKRTCYIVSTDVERVVKDGSGELFCGLAREVSECLSLYEKDVESEQRALNDLFDKAQSGKLKADLVAAIGANRRERLAAATKRLDEAAGQFALGEGKDVEAVYQIVMPMGGPADYASHSRELTLGPSVANGSARIASISDNAGGLLSKFKSKVAESERHYVVSADVPTTFEVVTTPESKLVGNGYRYRVPVSAPTSLTVFKTKEKTQFEFGPHIERKVVAQYGPIAALTSSFKGKGGHVVVKHWPDSGGLQTVEIGAEAIPTSAVTSVIDTAAAQYKARKDKAVADAATAAAADPELDALTRQQKLLALQKQIKDLEAELAKKDQK